MIPILYESNETEFTSNGIGRLPDMISAKPKKTRNGIFEVEFEYPITGRRYDDILEGRIIAMLHDETGDIQPFDIYGRTAPLDGVVTFYARHISYRLGEITVQPFTASSCAQALQFLKTNSITNNPFTFWTDKAVSGDFKVEVPSNLKSLLGGTEGSILDVYGTGEYEFDKWDVKLHLHRGSDTGVEIRYGKNLADLQDEIDYSDCYTGVVPYWQGKDGDTETVVTIDGYVINSGNTSYGNRQIIVPLDLSSEFQEKPTKAQLEATAQTWLANSEAWLPSRTIKVDFVQLWQTEEYKNYAPLQRVGLCDTVTVCYPRMNINVKMKVIEVTYDALAERYTEMVLGSTASTYADLIKAESAKQIAEAHNRIMRIIGNSNYATQTELQEAVQNATDLITGGLGGYVVFGFNANGKPEELLILDDEDITQAVNVWRWNKNGLGFSSNGYSGPFGIAITSDGKIVADYVLTGSLTANLIKAGILMDAAGTNYWNMQTGEFRLAAQTQVGSSGQTLNDLAAKANTIATVDVEYALGTSSTTAPTSGWSTNTPTWESGKYVWTRTKTENGAGTVSYSNPTCIQGAKGEAGTSVTILGSYNTYADLIAAHPTGSAGDAYLVNGDLYVWSTNSSAWSNVGNIQGPQGTAGANGVGISSTVISYGKSASGSTEPSSWQSTIPSVSSGEWLWVRTVYTYTDSSTYTFKTKSYIGTDGADGKSVYVRSATKSGGVTTVVLTDGTNTTTLTIADGEDGDDGQAGANGYVHVAWATSADGSQGFSTSVSAGKTYLGTYTDNTQADSQTYSDYSWSLIKGADGTDGADGNGIQSVTVTYGLSASASTRPTSWQTTIPSASQGEYIWTRTVTDYTDASVADTVTYTYSRQGVDGESGTDGTSVEVSSITYQQGDSMTTPPTGTWSSTIPTVQPGKNLWTKTVFSDGTIAYGVAHQGYDGTDGTNGTNGVGISTIAEQYYLSASKTTQTGGSWSTTQPTWVSGKYIWTRSEITWTDNTVSTTSPVLAEAVNNANETAKSANDTAEEASEAVTALDNSLTQTEIFNRLTNNGQTQGIYLQNGKVYINAEYIASGKISSQNGLVYFDLDNNELHCDKLISTITTSAVSRTTTAHVKSYEVATGYYTYGLNIYNGTYPNYGIGIYPQTGTAVRYAPQIMVDRSAEDFYITHGMWGSLNPYTALVLREKNVTLQGYYDGTYDPQIVLTGSTSKMSLYAKQQISLSTAATSTSTKILVTGYFQVNGTKSRIVETDDYGDRLLYCYETPSPMFGDVGEGVIGEDGLCYVWLDPIFEQTITTLQYQVFLQKYGTGDCWVSERHQNYFVVEGTKNLRFGWELKAKQSDFDQFRLDVCYDEGPNISNLVNHVADAEEHLNKLYKEKIEL